MKAARLIFGFLPLLFFACQKDPDNIGDKGGTTVSGIIAIKSLSALQVEADSATPCQIAVQINPNTDSVSRSVIFTTSNGTFSNSTMSDTVTPDANGIATASFVSNIPGDAKVTADLQSYIVDTVIEFTPALPDRMLVTSSAYTGRSSDTITIDCDLFRNITKGKVSDPVEVSFKQSPSSSPGQGLVFAPFAASAAGKASVMIFNPYQITGTFQLIASTPADSGGTLVDTVTLIIK